MKCAYICLLILISACGSEPTDAALLQSSVARGKTVYAQNCIACHGSRGEGIFMQMPPLAKSDYLLASPRRAIEQLINGLEGPITVNGDLYDGIMPPQPINDQEIMDVMNYILNSWGNEAPLVRLEFVQSIRDSLAK